MTETQHRRRQVCPVDRGTVHRLIRYSAVSVVSTCTSLVILALLVGGFGLAPVWSNVIATGVGTVPSFELNRRWVWQNTGQRSLFRQVVPFCALSFAGLVVSTVTVALVSGQTSGWSRWSHTGAILAANVAAYGSLWVGQYLLADRVLFGHASHGDERPVVACEATTKPVRETVGISGP
jgi:putative flippase GtrA